MRRILSELGIALVFLIVAVILTWPLAIEISTAVSDPGDPLFCAFVIDWVCYALTHAPLQLYNPPIYHTGIYPLAYSENMIGIALVVLPFHVAGLPPLAVYNIAMLLGFAFSAYGAFVLARLVTGHAPAAIVAGMFYAFTSFCISHVSHVQIVWGGWLPLLLAALLVYWRRGDLRGAVLLGGAFVMNGLTNIYWLLFGSVALALTIPLLAVADPRTERRFWLRLVTTLLIASLVLLPILIPYQVVANAYRARRTSFEARLTSASPADWLVPSSRNALYGDLIDPARRRVERDLFPGLLPLFLIAATLLLRRRDAADSAEPHTLRRVHPRALRGLDVSVVILAIAGLFAGMEERVVIGRIAFSGADVPLTLAVALIIVRLLIRYPYALRRSRFTPPELSAALWMILGFIGSLGWNAFLHPFLFRVVTPFRATRVPARWAAIAYVGIAVWVAVGVVCLLEGRSRRARFAIMTLLLAAITIEVMPDIRWDHVDARVRPVYAWLARERPGVVLELPIFGDGVQFRYVLSSSAHRQPLINGTSGWESPLHETLREKEEALAFDDAFLRILEESDCAAIIVHTKWLSPERQAAVAPWLDQNVKSGRLAVVRRFEDGDVVYGLRSPIPSPR